RYRVDAYVPHLQYPRQPRRAALQQLRLVAGAVVRRRVGEDDESDAERAEPAQIRASAEPVIVIEEAVLRVVVLAEPPSRQRNAGAREVDGVPVSRRVDGLDPVGLAQVLVQGADCRAPGSLRRSGVFWSS